MSTASEDESVSDGQSKQSWEIRKLQAEVAALQSPFKTPAVLGACILAVVSMIGNVLQWNRYNDEYAVAQIKTAQLELGAALLRSQEASLAKAIATKNDELRAITRLIADTAASAKPGASASPDLSETRLRLSDAAVRLENAAQPISLPAVGLSASPGTIAPGEIVRLNWSSTNATSVQITPNIGYVAPAGTADVSPRVTTHYRITGTNSSGIVAEGSITVQVIGVNNK